MFLIIYSVSTSPLDTGHLLPLHPVWEVLLALIPPELHPKLHLVLHPQLHSPLETLPLQR